jgi:exodeoxyribonuclease (lambda-induced)
MSSLQRTPEWFKARRGRITASIAAACLGLDLYTSRQKAWRIILGTEPERDSRSMAWGREFEHMAINAYEAITGELVTPAGLVVHRQHNWLAASPDGLVGEHGLVEIKCPKIVPAEIPLRHRIQMLVQLACTGRQWCDYFAFSTTTVCLRMDRPSDGAIEGLIDKLHKFYMAYIVPQIEPPRKKVLRKKRSV